MEDRIRRLLRICAAEGRLGFRNSAVFGGFAKHVRSLWAEEGASRGDWSPDLVSEILEGYENHDLQSREVAVAELQRGLEALLAGKSPADTAQVEADWLEDEAPAVAEAGGDWAVEALVPSLEVEESAGHVEMPPAPPSTKRERKGKRKRKTGKEEEGKEGSEPPVAAPIGTPQAWKLDEDELLDSSVRYCKGVGPKRAALLAKLGIETQRDLVFHFPHRYEDRRRITPIARMAPGRNLSIRARVQKVGLTGRGRHARVVATVVDETASCSIVWFNQGYLLKALPRGASCIFYGRASLHFGHLQLQNPEWEVLEEGARIGKSCRITPVYPLTEGIHQKQIHRLLDEVLPEALPRLEETLPEELLARFHLVGLRQAMAAIHRPAEAEDVKQARRRLVFEELFLLQVALAIKRHFYGDELPGVSCHDEEGLVGRFLEHLPFVFTGAQRRSLDDILKDLAAKASMSRLLQGEVGSGKTVVALAAMLACVGDGFQAALMAPTEILAEQHYLNLRRMCEPLGVRVDLLVGGQGKAERRRLLDRVLTGVTQIVVGTHALIQGTVEFRRIGLIVIDEQHRFGVAQRARLRRKGLNPNLLVMTATPIPRTLCLTLYGDLDLSVIDEMPPGRIPVETRWLTFAEEERVWQHCREELRSGRQAFVVCPLIEESENMQAEAATDTFNRLRTGPLKDFSVELLHGRMCNEEKDEVMDRVREGSVDVLVATTVIEVGVDVANASILAVLNAERFGLAQLHQLRGRIGRGRWASTCYLVGEALTDEARKRLEIMERTNDGFAVAEEDLSLRGPGEFFGTRQSGLPGFKIADITRDLPVLEAARREAAALVARDPYLTGPGCRYLRQVTSIKFREFLAFRH